MLHLVIAPILIPLITAALQLLAGRRRRWVSSLSMISILLLIAAIIALMWQVMQAENHTLVYNIGHWPTDFAIVLVADYLAVLMLLITAILAFFVLPYALGRWQYQGAFFQPLIQLLILGLNGAFLTGDLFNLFVFFEVLLAASYGLALHGSGKRRTAASLHYISINLAASMLFLIGLALVYGVTGTLNMAVLAHKIPDLPNHTRHLLHAGAALIAVTFLTKAAIWPLGFWLPRTYSASTAPAAALFAIMTKLGIYIILRLSLLLFGPSVAESPSAAFGQSWLVILGAITIIVGTIGLLGARQLGKIPGYCVLVSSGTLLSAIALQSQAITTGALAYLIISIISIAAFFLLVGLILPENEPEDSEQLAPYDPVSDELYAHEDERSVVKPVPVVILSSCFFVCALLITGLPPLSGFLAKFAMLAPMLDAGLAGTALFALIIFAGLCSIIALCRAGMHFFWAQPYFEFPAVRAGETASAVALLAVGVLLTIFIAPPWQYLSLTTDQLYQPQQYIHTVLSLGGQP